MKFSPILVASVAPALIAATALTGCTELKPYTIKSGDTLTKVAEAEQIQLDSIKSFNVAAASFDSIAVNQTFLIPNRGCTYNFCSLEKNYTVKAGDTLGAIAASYGSTLAAVQHVNPQIKNINSINAGDVIYIPLAACNLLYSVIAATDNCVDSATISKTYTAVAGDTFYVIANQKLGVTLDALKAANSQVTNFDAVQVGQVINVPLCKTCVAPTNKQYGSGTYEVVSGDTFTIISRQKLNITLSALEGANKDVTDINKIDVGQKLKVPICAPGFFKF